MSIYDQYSNTLEVIQIKAYSSPLVLSNFEPSKPLSFFNRISPQMKLKPQMKVSIVSFGEFGPELRGALTEDGSDRRNVAKRLSKHGYVTEQDAYEMLTNIHIETVNEEDLFRDIKVKLSQMLTGIDPDNAFDILNYWLYLRSEKKETITRKDVVEKINSVGRFLAERATHHQEWNTVIVPIEDKVIDEVFQAKLSEEFYQGVSTRYEHILAGLDIPRRNKMEEINQKFDKERIVIIHGASGQGKTTLAFRFLKEYLPELWRFKIQTVENRLHALSIATALKGHADAIGIPLIVYMDISPNDNEWVELVKQLSSHQNIRVLVTVREEDWKRASVAGYEFKFEEIELSLDRTEASQLYEAFVEKRTSSPFLNFEEAWNRFGEGGPLLEFVYLITQGTTLCERLKQQIERLEQEVETGTINRYTLDLLHMVAFASAFGARLQVKLLIDQLGVRVPGRVFKLLEKEYLIRLTDNQSLVQGLHPIRSEILIELLSESFFVNWIEIAKKCLPMIHEEDIEGFLMHAFSRRKSDIPDLLKIVSSYRPKRWIGVFGVTRALIWLGIANYIEENDQLLSDVYQRFADGCMFVLDFDIANVMVDSGDSYYESFMSLIPQKGQEEIHGFRTRQTDKKRVFTLVKEWLSSLDFIPEHPNSDFDWNGLSFVAFWIGKLGVSSYLINSISYNLLDQALNELSIETLANLIHGVYYAQPEVFENWVKRNIERIIQRFNEETFTVHFHDDGTKVFINFIIDFLKLNSPQWKVSREASFEKSFLNTEAISRLSLLRKLLPNRKLYASKGYGHNMSGFNSDYDETKKEMNGALLGNEWLTSVNATFRRLVQNRYRLSTWQLYTEQLLSLRKSIISQCKDIEIGIKEYFKKRELTQPIQKMDVQGIDQLRDALNRVPRLPLIAVDEWGLTEDTSESADNKNENYIMNPRSLANDKFISYRRYLGEYTRSFSNFFNQCIHVLCINPVEGRGRGRKKDLVRNILIRQGIKPDLAHLSTVNLAEACKALPKLQREFRKHFGHLVNQHILRDLENQEQRVLNRFAPTWFFFANYPQRIMKDAVIECEKAFNETKREFLKQLERKLCEVSDISLHLSIHSEQTLYKGEQSLWIKVDYKQVPDRNFALDRIYAVLQKVLSEHKDSNYHRFVLDICWRYLVIVPLVEGKRIGEGVWEIHLLSLLLNPDYKPQLWNLIPYEVSEDLLSELELYKWVHPYLEIVSEINKGVGLLFILINHLQDLLTVPQIDQLMEERFSDYYLKLEERLGVVFEKIGNSVSKMLEVVNQKMDEESPISEELVAVTHLMSELLSLIQPPDKTITDIELWISNLTQAIGLADIITMYWAFFVIHDGKHK
ncbi:hypothetical protein I532_24562 [Brevibacillus borstelensis AK1]|uniref:Novel STAND NTPase 5 domain-containing protein n=1 Tax=Brevibacillus borstelensis AK1 TaxID=1300222 RepID=M8D9I7_9BACL|nr:hypothetical protein I532_24562 [Brevibacillus borstelensis AK1]